MPVTGWHELTYFDMVSGADSTRYTAFSGHGSYWVSAPATLPGRSRRAQREEVREKLAAAIDLDLLPGEVTDELLAEARAKAPKTDADQGVW